MARYKVELKKSAQKEIRDLPPKDRVRILSKIEGLKDDPRGKDCKKLSAQERYRVRVGRYRILYEIHDLALIVMVVRVAHRKEVYQR